MFNEGTVSGPADIIPVFNFSPRVVKEVEGNCSHIISYPPSKFQQSGSQWWQAHSILGVSSKLKPRGERSDERDGQVIGPPQPIHFP
jgi:hypothetical protein